MRYSYEFKLKCIEMYRSDRWPDTPTDVEKRVFRSLIREWTRSEAANGPEVLKKFKELFPIKLSFASDSH